MKKLLLPIFVALLLLPQFALASCTEGYTENYRCFNNYKQREFRFQDCTTEWVDVKCCTECSNGECIEPKSVLYASVTTPEDLYVNDTLSTKVWITNDGSVGRETDVNVYLCKYDGSDCIGIVCDGNIDNEIYISAHSTKTLSCSKAVREIGSYKIKVTYTDESRDPTIYSRIFKVLPRERCKEKELSSYRCRDSFIEREVQKSDCSTTWTIVNYCKYGCAGTACIEPKLGIPQVTLEPYYEVECGLSSFIFSAGNLGGKETFDVSVIGRAVDWIRVPPKITLGEDEKEYFVGYFSIPCEAKPGEYDFTVKLSNEYSASDKSLIKLRGAETFSNINDIAFLIVFVAALAVVLLFLKKRLPKKLKEEAFLN